MRAAARDIGQFLATFFAPELRAWRGEASPGFVFWVYGVAGSSILAALTARALVHDRWEMLQALIVGDLAYTVWVLVAIWRCSARAGLFWGSLARVLTVAWGLNTLFVLLFVEIELATRHASG